MFGESEKPELAHSLIGRREFLGRNGLAFGAIALAGMGLSAPARNAAPHHPARARRVIYIHQAGSPSQQDTYDCKPVLQSRHGELCPQRFIEGKRLAFIKGHPELLASPYKHRAVGDQGLLLGAQLQHFEKIVDRVTVVRSMTTDQFNHAPAQLLLHTGTPQFGGASIGAWASYGLGTLNADLPAFVVMVSGDTDPSGGKSLWGSGYLPPEHQAVQLRGRGEPILFLENPPGVDRARRRRTLDALKDLDRLDPAGADDLAVRSRLEQCELAFRMQAAVPGAVDLSRETEETRNLYGARIGEPSFANNCLMARRLVERGVRFVQLYDWGWDLHGTAPHDDLVTQFPKKCLESDQALAGLIIDLDRRGLLEDTLVICGGEFGRTPMREARNGSKYLGRDHHPDCFSLWMAGGGIRRGYVHGESCEFGHDVVRDPMSVRDLQATILHLLGLDPERFSYPHQGLDQRLIGPASGPKVQTKLLA